MKWKCIMLACFVWAVFHTAMIFLSRYTSQSLHANLACRRPVSKGVLSFGGVATSCHECTAQKALLLQLCVPGLRLSWIFRCHGLSESSACSCQLPSIGCLAALTLTVTASSTASRSRPALHQWCVPVQAKTFLFLTKYPRPLSLPAICCFLYCNLADW